MSEWQVIADIEMWQMDDIEEFKKNPEMLLSADARESLTHLAEEGITKAVRVRASRLLAAVPCPSCIE